MYNSTKKLESLISQGVKCHENGQFMEAEIFYKDALKIKPNNFSALQLYGTLLSQVKKNDQALYFLNKAIQINPYFAPCHNNIGLVFHDLNRLDDALISFTDAIKYEKNYAEPFFNKGNVLFELNRIDEALNCFDKAIEIKPDYIEAFFHRALILQEKKQFPEALASYDAALNLNSNYTEAYFNKGYIFHELKKFDQATIMYTRVITLKPDYAEAYFGLGYIFQELGQFQMAIQYYDEALALKPNYAHAYLNKGIALEKLQQTEAAIYNYQKSLFYNPDIDWGIGALTHLQMLNVIWSDFDKNISIIRNKILEKQKAVNPFALLSMVDDPDLQKKCAEIFHLDGGNISIPKRNLGEINKTKKIRLGYISADFNTSPVGMITAELFEIHDRNKFEVFGFSLKNLSKDDALSNRIKKSFDKFIDVSELKNDSELANMIEQYQIDIAIDLAGYTKDAKPKIFNYRVAPIQINWLGFPGTTGSKNVDYIVGDDIVTPSSNYSFYSEKVIHLPNSLMPDDSYRIPSTRVFTKKDLGLPEKSFIFCSFNSPYKFNPLLFDSWSRILINVKESVLWLSKNSPLINDNIINEFINRGISPSRVIFAEKLEKSADHLARLSQADLFLDCYPYTAQTTALDALKGGLPLLTICGRSHASRIASSLLNAIGLNELITLSDSSYESLAIELALNQSKLTVIKEKLVKNKKIMPLFNSLLFAKNLESAYVKVYERFYNNLAPDHIFLEKF
jgi:protein O-GlcNAc transferase